MKMLKEFMGTIYEGTNPKLSRNDAFIRAAVLIFKKHTNIKNIRIFDIQEVSKTNFLIIGQDTNKSNKYSIVYNLLKISLGGINDGNAVVVNNINKDRLDQIIQKQGGKKGWEQYIVTEQHWVNESRSPRESLAIATVKQFIDKKGDMFAAGKEFDKKFGKKNVSYSDVQFPLYTIKIGSVKVYVTNKKYMSGEDTLAGKNKQIAIAI